ncbi:MAG TPA: PEP-CTERM sorting domain-containing protein [Phenylobacterium sp.]|uniref:PEP-CTERM sorting domain-containing protein n=1 Tax=Phenylobacterium sp. TaxID=1871053 RepID=UPI002B4A896A|nr:PEP-CTERM sorting domain-containing protein [Phenylobacterium sp.]HKR87738.1 PEP-CTERM sorting domain-containing protein [Phenylobacterium sp.]
MNKILVAATAAFALAGAATAASATTFAGTWSTTYNSSDAAGLPIVINNDASSPASGNFNFNLTGVGSSTSVNLFTISTDQNSLDSNDGTPKAFTLSFNFTAPQAASGSVGGVTEGESVPVYFHGWYVGSTDEGALTWNNGGNTTLNFGSYGKLLVHLDDVTFNLGGSDCDPATVAAKFTLASAVPEPMTWALMLTGFFGMGAAMRANRRRAAFTAA